VLISWFEYSIFSQALLAKVDKNRKEVEKGKWRKRKLERKERLYPISEKKFPEAVLPVIEAGCRGKGRPPKVSPYKAFCGILYILRTGRPWRDLPEEYGRWHVVYDRFSRSGGRGLWGKILLSREKRRG
jgi:hypothetical protein